MDLRFEDAKLIPGTRNVRGSFDKASREYDEIRPGYPEQLIEDIIRISRITEGGKILEVGCGTGQATMPFAKKGYGILCLDVGRRLAATAREKFKEYPNVRILNTSFEHSKLIGSFFDLLISATAFHWIQPDVSYSKAAQALKRSGYLALFWNTHPSPFTGFFKDVQEIYDRIMPMKSDSVSPTARIVTEQEHYLKESRLFEEVEIRKYRWSINYSADSYLKLLSTYSDHRRLSDKKRSQLYDDIRKLIESRYGGAIERPYLSVLIGAKKRT